ncbi:MAG: SPW repeat protein [Thermodesulfobacteriota bacterium]
MERSLIGWMIFQVLVGIWLFVSPFVLGFREMTNATTNTMLFGAVVVLIGLGMSIFNKSVCGMEHETRKTS